MKQEGPGRAKLELREVTKSYGTVTAVEKMSLEVREGEILILLGPSGCGKTTTLRLVAGFLQPSGGEILIDGKLVGSAVRMVPPNLRNLAMVFQNYALWPHKNVFDNIAYGLQIRKVSKREIRERVERVLELMRLKEYQNRYPQELSGGQQQRISLARAIVIEPSILLFDEPLSNLDAKLREEMRFELKDLQRRLGFTSLYVTHDQEEALSIGDRIAVMNQGKIEQIGGPEEIYRKSSSQFVVSFVGLTNLIPAKVLQINEDGTSIRVGSDPLGELLISSGFSFGGPLSVDEEILINIRPEDVNLLAKGDPSKGPNLIPGRVTSRSFLGSMIDYRIDVKGISFRVQAHPSHAFHARDEVLVLLDPKAISWFKKN